MLRRAGFWKRLPKIERVAKEKGFKFNDIHS